MIPLTEGGAGCLTGGDFTGGEVTGGDLIGGEVTGGDLIGGEATGGDLIGGDFTEGGSARRGGEGGRSLVSAASRPVKLDAEDLRGGSGGARGSAEREARPAGASARVFCASMSRLRNDELRT